MDKKVSVKYTAKLILREKSLDKFCLDEQTFLKEMSKRLNSTPENVVRLCEIANQVGSEIVYISDVSKTVRNSLSKKPLVENI